MSSQAPTKEEFQLIAKELEPNERIRIAWLLQTNLVLRVGDTLRLKIKDLWNEDGSLKKQIQVKESKKNKTKIVEINGKTLLAALESYYPSIKDKNRNCYWHVGPKGGYLADSHIRAKLLQVKKTLGLKQLSTHSARKYIPTLMNQRGDSIYTISRVLNHSDVKTTIHYISYLDKDAKKAMVGLTA